jgi:hypothetical protein
VKAESRWSPEVGIFRTRRVSKSGEEPTERLLIGDSKGGISGFICSWSIGSSLSDVGIELNYNKIGQYFSVGSIQIHCVGRYGH